MKPLVFWLFIAAALAVMTGLVVFALYSTNARHDGLCPPENPHCEDMRR
jgi:hypothetical protein